MQLFLTSVAAKVLDQIIPFLKKEPQKCRVAFVGTAADLYEDKWFAENDRAALARLGFVIQELSIAQETQEHIAQVLDQAAAVFVAGGHTAYLLEKAQKSGFAPLVKERVKKGLIYIGSSAGSIIAGPSIEPALFLEEPVSPALSSYDALSLVNFVVLPHYGSGEHAYKEVMEKFQNDYHLLPLRDNEMVVASDKGYQIIESKGL